MPAPSPPAPRQSWLRRAWRWIDAGAWSAWLSSAAVHAIGIILLSLLVLTAPQERPALETGEFDALPAEDVQLDLEGRAEIPELPLTGGPASLGDFGDGDEVSLPGPRTGAIGEPNGTAPGIAIPTAPVVTDQPLANTGPAVGGRFQGLTNPLASRGGGLEGRHFENRRALALSGGGTEQSEEAVERALVWFAEHQWQDGGWRFDLEKCPRCAGYCRNSGAHTSATAATGLALLSFLGAGYTHEQGKYQEVVSRGIYFLHQKMIPTSFGGDLRDNGAALEAEVPLGGGIPALDAFRRDSMYSHGIATLALTECYAMTRDEVQRGPAEQAVKFTVNAQYNDGGWRYAPKFESPGAGDTTVTGWQLASLKSATLAGIDVPYEVWTRANEFLDGVQDKGGSSYLYMRGRPATGATAAAGLLCRMMSGWPRDHRPLQQGVARLGSQAPNKNNMYFNYYASQVLQHVRGPHWERWNPKMRQYLVDSQATDGHEAGSWYFAEDHSTPGGRLYTTAMATLTLEVYYRYMPMYKEAFVDRAP